MSGVKICVCRRCGANLCDVADSDQCAPTGRLVVAAFEDLAAVQRAAAFTALNVYRTGDSVCVLYILVRPGMTRSPCLYTTSRSYWRSAMSCI